ncbi:two component transcriptional regulator, LuxR family [Hymenobacter roseosalivarius DSM 11622]|uniref:Two component transcriptional regulator, LuxR family n=1 Tax=Hymenobacter roseosalivarius DSM 11622 TaxID=645990 RepID=A0A1W1VPE2_9BACT|nr:response regulator transcription factor [Hymenobacter roseosalivarius]SMB95227.1 two component transcriptional regulator, LuxR family [Hymenobacter roseosalivarius DSM 11622]
MIRLILADDHAIIRDGIRALLTEDAGLEITAEAGNGQELLDKLTLTPCDVVLMDVNMPVLDGFGAMPHLRQDFPEVKVLVLSMLDHPNYVARMLNAGASGYVLKNADIAEISHAIRMVAAGRQYLGTEIGMNLLQQITAGNSLSEATTRKTNDLSKRELEVLTLIAEGLTNAEIADKLFTSKRTIETHRQNIIEKTQAKNTAALIKFAVSEGLIE